MSWLLVSLLMTARAYALPCAHDDALTRAAAELIEDDAPLSPRRIASAARRAGSDAPAVHALRDGEGDDARVAAWLSDLRARSSAELACGEAWGDRGRLVLASIRAGSILPDAVDAALVRGELARGFTAPEIVVRGADGSLVRIGVDRDELRRGVRVAEERSLPVHVQLVAHGPHGPMPVAERVLGGDPEAFDAGAFGEPDLDARIAEIRGAHRASPLRANRLLREAAHRHAQHVCTAGRVAHVTEAGDDPEARLARQGIEARVVGEVIARATSPAAAMDALEASPSHRYTLADRRFTDAGLGLATDARGRSCLVVVLAAWPRFVGR